ncbi:DUF6234 family protein [Streptomyces sp. NPDC087903]|uniref:DUF6234 family protein n=1 Tax=Streptomyces sp. NPDC087903 TaxID=3365819 RepID=UPI003801E93B
MLLIEIPVAFLLGLASVIRGWGRADEQTVARPMDWVPILWLGGFTLGVLVVAVIFLYSAHPFAGAVQLLLAAIALLFTIAAWHDQYERAHPPPLPDEGRNAARSFEPRDRPVGPTKAGAEAQSHTGAATGAVMHTQPRNLRGTPCIEHV